MLLYYTRLSKIILFKAWFIYSTVLQCSLSSFMLPDMTIDYKVVSLHVHFEWFLESSPHKFWTQTNLIMSMLKAFNFGWWPRVYANFLKPWCKYLSKLLSICAFCVHTYTQSSHFMYHSCLYFTYTPTCVFYISSSFLLTLQVDILLTFLLPIWVHQVHAFCTLLVPFSLKPLSLLTFIHFCVV